MLILHSMLLTPDHDPMGRAILDQVSGRPGHRLIVSSSLFEDDEMPVSHLLRSEDEMPPLERRALELCRGRVLDVGAGAGCHSLALQQRGFNVTAIDISPLSVEAMQQRGIQHVLLADLLTDDSFGEGFDTILLLMNGLGMAGTAQRLPDLLNRAASLLNPGGSILADSSDLCYVFEDESGQFDPTEFDHYYGEVDYRMRYGAVMGPRFNWLYADPDLLTQTATACGLTAEIVARGAHYDYLARISRR